MSPQPLPDGRYEVLVVDAADVADADGARHVEVTLLEGDRKGDVIALSARGLDADPMDLLAAPGVLVVTAGEPELVLD